MIKKLANSLKMNSKVFKKKSFIKSKTTIYAYKCKCTGKTYSSKAIFKAHQKTKIHRQWVLKGDKEVQKEIAIIIQVYECKCTGKKYFSKSRLKVHRKSKAHQHWVLKKEAKELRREAKELKNSLIRKELELEKYKQMSIAFEKMNTVLLDRLIPRKNINAID